MGRIHINTALGCHRYSFSSANAIDTLSTRFVLDLRPNPPEGPPEAYNLRHYLMHYKAKSFCNRATHAAARRAIGPIVLGIDEFEPDLDLEEERDDVNARAYFLNTLILAATIN